MRTEHLKYLVESVDLGSMNKAAKQLFLTQPAISSAISAIEEEVGFPVVDRSTMRPTSKGMMIIDDARIILNTVERWTSSLTDNTNERKVKGEISVADYGEIGLTLFRDAVADFNRQYPNVIVHTVEPGNMLQQLNSGSYEMAILPVLPIHQDPIRAYLKHFQWEMEYLFQDFYKLVVNKDHPFADRRNIRSSDLYGQHILVQKNYPYVNQLRSAGCSWNFENTWNILTAVLTQQEAGMLLSNQDLLIGEFLKSGTLRTISFMEPYPVNYYLIYMERAGRSEAGAAVVQFVKNRYQNYFDTLSY